MHTKEEVQGTFYSNADLKKLILPLIMEQLLSILIIQVLRRWLPAAPLLPDMLWGSATKKSAISITVSRTTTAGIIFYLLFRSDKVNCFKQRVTAKLNLEQIKKILYIGIPNGLENSLFQQRIPFGIDGDLDCDDDRLDVPRDLL